MWEIRGKISKKKLEEKYLKCLLEEAIMKELSRRQVIRLRTSVKEEGWVSEGDLQERTDLPKAQERRIRPAADRAKYWSLSSTSRSSTHLAAASNTLKPKDSETRTRLSKKEHSDRLVTSATCAEGGRLMCEHPKLFPFSGDLKQKQINKQTRENRNVQDIFKEKWIQADELIPKDLL